MKNENEYKFFWKCCNKEYSAPSLTDARIQLEEHELKFHNKKQVGSFGYNVKTNKKETP